MFSAAIPAAVADYNGIKELVVMLRDPTGSNSYTGALANPADPDGTWWTDNYRA
jgi:hypothetical protein